MRRFLIVFALAAFALVNGAFAHAQQNNVLGDVVATDVAAKQIIIKTDAGAVVIVSVSDTTKILKNPPGEKGVDKAKPMTLAEIGAGDRALALGRLSDDGKTLAGPRIVVINTKAELAAKQEAERADWKARGVVGTVSAINPTAKEIVLTTGRSPEGTPQTIVVAADGPNVVFRRYAPDSVKFADAKPSTFEELKSGDQLRAKGAKSEDGKRFAPEEVVSGSFRTILGTVTAVDAEKNEITVKSAQGNQDVSVVVSKDSMLKRFPDMGAMGGGGGGGGIVMRPQGSPAGGGQGPGAGGPGGGGQRRVMGGGPDMIQEMMERLPPTTVAEVKPGQMIVFSTTGVDPKRVTAIQLIAGVEPLVAMMQARGGARPGGAAGPGFGDGSMGFSFGIGQP